MCVTFRFCLLPTTSKRWEDSLRNVPREILENAQMTCQLRMAAKAQEEMDVGVLDEFGQGSDNDA